MCEFVQDKHYYFIGNPGLIEDFKHDDNTNTNTNNTNNANTKTPLGKFIEYIGLPYVSDWLHDAKARFEYGVISRGYYDSVLAEVNDTNQGMK
jgi:hypothetical protein